MGRLKHHKQFCQSLNNQLANKQKHKMKPEINRERFEAWLFAQPEDRVVDLGSTDSCLMCSFVQETSPNQINFTGWKSFYWKNTGDFSLYSVPEWFDLFINKRFRGKALSTCKVTFSHLQKLYTEEFGCPEQILPEPKTSSELNQQQLKEKEEAYSAHI